MTTHKNEAHALVWFRLDLRLEDNPAFQAAIDTGLPIIPVYILPDDKEEAPWNIGGVARWWLHHGLIDLEEQLKKYGLKLIIGKGGSLKLLQQWVKECHVSHMFWNRRYEPKCIERDAHIKKTLTAQSVELETFNGYLLHEPHTVYNKSSKPFQVFTPFWKQCLTLPMRKKVKMSFSAVKSPKQWPDGLTVNALKLLPKIHWDSGFSKIWEPTREEGLRRLKTFLKSKINAYESGRDVPAIDGTSTLSPYLHFGQISVREIFDVVESSGCADQVYAKKYIAELGWREFAYHLLYHFPQTTNEPLHSNFAHFPWKPDAEKLQAWQKGLTGYPIVDAGMRQLWETGWMHNRVRMIVASFLVKHLLQPWQFGAEWFWDTLVDADLASNTLGWQWSAGCGADAAPYFRIFNPILQSQKFDPEGEYIRRYVPELGKLSNRSIHTPWLVNENELSKAGITLGKQYPHPIVDHNQARQEALAAFETLKKTNQNPHE